MTKTHLRAVVAVLAVLTWVFVGCSSVKNPPSGNNNPPPAENIDLKLTLRISEWANHEVNSAALVVHDASGASINYRVFNQPQDGSHSVTFNEVPANGYVTVLSNSTRHLTWPAENDYDYTVLATFPIALLQNNEGSFYANFYFSGITLPVNMRIGDLHIQGPCPNGSTFLIGESFIPYENFWYASDGLCTNGTVDDSLWVSLQNNGKASLVLWPADDGWQYIKPLSYLALIDKDPSEIHTFTSADFSNDVQTARMTVQGIPGGSWVRYRLTALRGGVPLFGFSPDLSESTDNTASAQFANILGNVDQIYQTVEVSHSGSGTAMFKMIDSTSFNADDSWNLADFLSLPDVDGLSLRQNPRLVVHANGFGDGNVLASFRVRTISGGNSPKYVYWYAYDQTESSTSALQFTYPELPEVLSVYSPDISADYVSLRVGGADYNSFDDASPSQGRSRSAYRLIRDNFPSTSGVAPTVDGREFHYPFPARESGMVR